MLVQEERIQEAVDYASERFSTPEAALELAKTLRAHDETQAALRVAKHGLTLDGDRKDTLAAWLRDRAASAGDRELALEAAITAFETSPSLNAYEAVKELADHDWETIKTDLLEFLRMGKPGDIAATRACGGVPPRGTVRRRIELGDRTKRTSVIEPVVEVVTEERPQWVISTCKSQAEPIIEQGQHDNYRTAVRWLRRAGEAARAADELDQWREYVETMREEHYRKYKLRPMLDDLWRIFEGRGACWTQMVTIEYASELDPLLEMSLPSRLDHRCRSRTGPVIDRIGPSRGPIVRRATLGQRRRSDCYDTDGISVLPWP